MCDASCCTLLTAHALLYVQVWNTSTLSPTCTKPTPAAINVDDDMALLKPAAAAAAAALLLLLPAATAAFASAAALPAAAATLLVVTESSGTLKSLVVVLNTDRATPTPASWLAPAAVGRHAYIHVLVCLYRVVHVSRLHGVLYL
jgi:hypothetical protein